MKIEYERDIDMAYVELTHYPVATTKQYKYFNLDFDHNGRIVGFEIFDASKHLPKEFLHDKWDVFGNFVASLHPAIGKFITAMQISEVPRDYYIRQDGQVHMFDLEGQDHWSVTFNGPSMQWTEVNIEVDGDFKHYDKCEIGDEVFGKLTNVIKKIEKIREQQHEII